jgi:hypothetical protein
MELIFLARYILSDLADTHLAAHCASDFQLKESLPCCLKLLRILWHYLRLVHQYILNIIEHQKVGEAGLITETQVDLHTHPILKLTNLNSKKTVGLGHSFEKETIREDLTFEFECGNVEYKDQRL